MLYATVFTETSIMDIKSRCLSLQCGTDSKLVDTDCWFYLPVICSDRKISMYISSSNNIYMQVFTDLFYSYISQKIMLLPSLNGFCSPRVQLICKLNTSTSKLIEAVAKQT